MQVPAWMDKCRPSNKKILLLAFLGHSGSIYRGDGATFKVGAPTKLALLGEGAPTKGNLESKKKKIVRSHCDRLHHIIKKNNRSELKMKLSSGHAIAL